MTKPWVWAMVCGIGCSGGAQDLDGTSTSTLQPPDLQGTYVAGVRDIAGCDGDGDLLLAWMNGELLVEGSPEALTFLFTSGDEVDGSVDTAFEVVLADTISRPDASLDLSGTGLAYIDADLWILEMDLEIEVSRALAEFPDCSLDAIFEAGQVSE